MIFGWFYFDWTIFLLIPAMIFAIVAQIKVKTTFDKYDKVRNFRGMSGAEAARRVLDRNGLYDVKIERVRGHLTDHYDPRTNIIRLSEATHDSVSVAAIGVAAHEAGHAVQHATGYFPIKVRAAIIPVTQIGSQLAMPIFLVGILLSYAGYINGEVGGAIMGAGILLFSLTAFFQLVTLPVEFNASSRALKVLEETEILYGEELSGAKSVLSAAAMTYVAALASSLASLLRLILIARGASNRRR